MAPSAPLDPLLLANITKATLISEKLSIYAIFAARYLPDLSLNDLLIQQAHMMKITIISRIPSPMANHCHQGKPKI